MAVLGLDLGEKTLGVAYSHDERVAVGITTLRRENTQAWRPWIHAIGDIMRMRHINKVVLGNPLSLHGQPSARSAYCQHFCDRLRRNFKGIHIVLFDERMTTRAVMRVLGSDTSKVDEMAAVLILQGYLDSKLRAGDMCED